MEQDKNKHFKLLLRNNYLIIYSIKKENTIIKKFEKKKKVQETKSSINFFVFVNHFSRLSPKSIKTRT